MKSRPTFGDSFPHEQNGLRSKNGAKFLPASETKR
jgi:hypothetical protein